MSFLDQIQGNTPVQKPESTGGFLGGLRTDSGREGMAFQMPQQNMAFGGQSTPQTTNLNINPVDIFNSVLPGVKPIIQSVKQGSLTPIKEEFARRAKEQDTGLYTIDRIKVGTDYDKVLKNSSNLVLGTMGGAGGISGRIQNIAKSKSANEIAPILESIGVQKSLIPEASRLFAGIDNPKTISSLLNSSFKIKVSGIDQAKAILKNVETTHPDSVVRNKVNSALYELEKSGDSPEVAKSMLEAFKPEIESLTAGKATGFLGTLQKPEVPIYTGEKDLTTKILKDLEGKTTVSKQYILDATNRGELKQVERDITRQVLEDMTTPKGTKVFSGASEVTPEWRNDKMSNFGTIFRGKNELGGGIYVTDAPEYAKTFGSKVTESSLNPNLNLFDVRESSAKKIGKEISIKIKNGFDNYDWYIKNGGEEILPTDLPEEVLGKIQNVYGANSTDILKKAGFDGVVGEESRFVGGQGGTVWNIFDAKNIKTKSSSDTINVKEFADKVKSELLPLKLKKNYNANYPKSVSESGVPIMSRTKFESISLPSEIRGNVKNYDEHLWESPIKTSAGNTHFPNEGIDNYFGHTRIEDMADNKTRRVIEVQSDLYQKGNLEKEGIYSRSQQSRSELLRGLDNADKAKYEKLSEKNFTFDGLNDAEKIQMEELAQKSLVKLNEIKKTEVSKLQQYNDPTAHFRMVREEIKKASQDGKTKLQFPTGETAMKIEGLDAISQKNWTILSDKTQLNPSNVKVGLEVSGNPNATDSQKWIITDVLGDGKFKAVPEDRLESMIEDAGIASDSIDTSDWINYAENHLKKDLESTVESFDISGKVDTNNPIYKFYEKDLGKYLNKFGAKTVVDSKGVSWYEVPISKEQGTKAVEAFKTGSKVDTTFDKETATRIFRQFFDKNEVDFMITKNLPKGTLGQFIKTKEIFSDSYKSMVKLLDSNGRVSDKVLYHESFHAFFNNFVTDAERASVLSKVKKEMLTAPSRGLKMFESKTYNTSDKRAEEWLADDFADYVKSKAGGTQYKGFFRDLFDRLLAKLRTLIRKATGAQKVYDDLLNKKRPGATTSKEVSALKEGKQVTEVDRLIAENKIRVVSRNGRDIYQYKKAGEWVNARDADSAVKQVTPIVKAVDPKIELMQTQLEMQKANLENSPFKGDNKIMVDKEGRVKELGDVKSKRTARIIQDRMAEANISDPAEFAQGLENFFAKKKEVAQLEKDIRTLKKSSEGVPVALTGRQKALVNSRVDLPKDIKPFLGEQGEVKSLEIQAKQALDILAGEEIPSGVSLPKIISQTVTPIQQRVHILDTYLRTPNRVMEKIGFGQEANELRGAMDGYWKELPKNIDKIAEWAKAVPKESNARIFKYLDGDAITLRPEEQKVADEIKTWLRGWADRLGLKTDQRVSDYITRIFDKDFTDGKTFPEEIAKMIADKIPGSVYNPFTLRRLGAKGYKQDTWQALTAYVKRGTRKVYLDPLLEKIQARAGSSLELSNIEKSQWQYVKKYVDNINMRPSELDESIDNVVRSMFGDKFGQRPVTQITRYLRQATFRGMLGLNLSSAMRNISQGINTYATLGEKWTTIGYVNLLKKGSLAELEREGVLNAGFIQDKNLSAVGKTLEKVDKGLFAFFDTAEKINRGSAYFGAKAKGISEGMSEDKAIEYAKGIVRKTQFVFDTVDTPVGMSGDIMKTVFQFQSFTTKQIEFLGEMAKDKNYAGLLRYAIGGLFFVYTIGQAFGMKPKELLPWYRFDVPASLKFPTALGGALLNTPDQFGGQRDLSKKASDVGKSMIGLIPAGSQINKTYQGYKAVTEGASIDKGGRTQFKVGGTFGTNAQALLFGKYAGQNAQDYFSGISPAERKYEEIFKSKDPKAKLLELVKTDPEMVKKVLKIKEQKDLGVTDAELKALGMGVANKQRAKWVKGELDKLKTPEEKKARLIDLAKKKILTTEVMKQVLQIK